VVVTYGDLGEGPRLWRFSGDVQNLRPGRYEIAADQPGRLTESDGTPYPRATSAYERPSTRTPVMTRRISQDIGNIGPGGCSAMSKARFPMS
jgi:hypothetical protein